MVAPASIAGAEQARTELRTAGGPLRLTVAADRDAVRADDSDLAYIAIALQDDDGNVASDRDRLLSVDVSGAGVLSGLGSANPRTRRKSWSVRAAGSICAEGERSAPLPQTCCIPGACSAELSVRVQKPSGAQEL